MIELNLERLIYYCNRIKQNISLALYQGVNVIVKIHIKQINILSSKKLDDFVEILY